MGSVKDHGSSLLVEVPKATFSNPILSMGIDTTVSDALVLLSQAFLPGIVNKTAVVGIVVLDPYAALSSK
jgi:hypothetical protein